MSQQAESDKAWHRKMMVAGRFYPKTKEAVLAQLKAWFSESVPKEKKRALFVPHAGWIYSGRFAAQVYAQTVIPKNVFILCPNHTGLGKRISVWSEGEWETPLGSVKINTSLAQAFLKALGESSGDQEAHREEHAIEVHLPFLKFLRPDVEIVPVVLGHLRWDDCQGVAAALTKMIEREPDLLLIASTDMSHYVSAVEAKTKDHLALSALEQMDPKLLYRNVVDHEISMCGFVPSTVVLQVCKDAGAGVGRLVCYGHSGEVTGDLESVVSYAGLEVR